MAKLLDIVNNVVDSVDKNHIDDVYDAYNFFGNYDFENHTSIKNTEPKKGIFKFFSGLDDIEESHIYEL